MIKEFLKDPAPYEKQIDRLHQKYLGSARLYVIKQDSVPLATIIREKNKVAKMLAGLVYKGEYQFSPAISRAIQTQQGKKRTVFSLRPADLIVSGVIADYVSRQVQPLLSKHVYGYVPKMGSWKAVFALSAYVRKNWKKGVDPKSSGLYYLKTDISSYTDSIPLGSSAPMWPALKELLLKNSTEEELSFFWDFIKSAIRPEMIGKEGGLFSRFKGLPMGVPMCTALASFYLLPLDAALESAPGAFYARYGDDLVFAHPDPRVVQDGVKAIEGILDGLGLSLHASKKSPCFLNNAGKCMGSIKGSQSITFLGATVSYDGNVSLDSHKIRKFLGGIRRRIKQTRANLSTQSFEQLGPVLCKTVNQALNGESIYCEAYLPFLEGTVTNRQQLKQIDHAIACMIAEEMTGCRGVRAFREVPYCMLREKWKLKSLCYSRGLVCDNLVGDNIYSS